MEAIARFLAQHPPFAQLAPEEVLRISTTLQIEYFPEGCDILTQGGTPAMFLYLIRRGTVDLIHVDDGTDEVIDTLGEGDLFGYVSLIRDRAPIVTVRTRTEVLAYLAPKAVFHRLRHEESAFALFFERSIAERLNQALRPHHPPADPELFQTRLHHLVRRAPITCSPDVSIRAAARIMREHDVSCLVVEGDPLGIITDQDLRNRVLAGGLSDSAPVAAAMSAPAVTLPADSLVFEALLLLLEHGFHHLPVTEGGRVVGVVTHTDILRRKSLSPLFLPRQLQRARTLEDLRAYADQVADTVGALLTSGAKVGDIGRVVAIAHDELAARLLRDAEAELGPPPCPYAWLVLGSEGRYEQTLRTDQDNALAYADGAPSEAPRYFAALAEQVVEQIVQCGFPRCPGEIMASNPQWRQPLAVWQGYFQRWISQPDEEALLRVAIFFDVRQVYGALDAVGNLRPIIAQARAQRVFLGRLARAALRYPAPLGFLRQLVLDRSRDQRDLLDLKLRGTAMIVDLARLFALEAGCAATNTLARLRQSAGHGSLSAASAEELVAAFELISLLRLRHQRQQLLHGEPPTNLVAITRLGAIERRELKEALLVVKRAQEQVELEFQTSMIA
jgi:CBS domain-containing protein